MKTIDAQQVGDLEDTLRVLGLPFSASCLRDAIEAYQAKKTRKTLSDINAWVKHAKEEIFRVSGYQIA